MKQMIFLSVLGLALVGCGPEKVKNAGSMSSAGSTMALATAASDAANIPADQVVMMVSGFACPFCANKLDHQMQKIDGVQEIIIDLNTGEVRVVVDKDNVPSRAALQQAVDDAGFTLNGVTFPD